MRATLRISQELRRRRRQEAKTDNERAMCLDKTLEKSMPTQSPTIADIRAAGERFSLKNRGRVSPKREAVLSRLIGQLYAPTTAIIIVRLYRFAWLLARGLIMIARVFVRPSVYHPVSVYKVLYVNRIPVPVYLVPTHLFLHRSLLLIHHSAHL